MSSSFRKPRLLLVLAALAAPVAFAQQRYFVPSVEVTAQHDTNRELRRDDDLAEESTSYKGTVELRMGRATPRGNTQVRPRVTYQEFVDREGVDPVEFMLDFAHEHRAQKGRFGINARYRQQDTINAELDDPGFDDSDPGAPPVVDDVDSGIVFAGVTRESMSVSPEFLYQFSERFGFGGTLQYEAVRYDEDIDSRRIGFDAPYAEFSLIRRMKPHTLLSMGPFVARYEADDDSVRTDTVGLRVGIDHQWSERSTVIFAVRGERNEITFFDQAGAEDSSDNWGVELVGVRANRIGSLRYAIGRFLQPSTLGNRRQADQIQLQYDRPLSERTTFKGALRVSRDESLSSVGNVERDRERFSSELSLTRLITPTWYLTAGYRFLWQDQSVATEDDAAADNHLAFLTVGFKARDPRRGGR